MGKKKAFAKGGNKVNAKKNPFNVIETAHKKKPKAVKSHIKKLQANVKAQQESSDNRLKVLHEQMVVKKQQPTPKKIILLKKPVKKAGPRTSVVQSNLEKMNVG